MRDETTSTLSLVRGHRWTSLLDHLAGGLRAELTDPFARARVIVASPATGRVVAQGIAARLGISAGIDYLAPSALMRSLAVSAEVEADRARWVGTPLTLAVADSLAEIAGSHPVLQRSLARDESRPARRLATAARLAGLFRTYLDTTPSLVERWLTGDDGDLHGEELPEHLRWEPDLLRSAVERLEVDPLDLLDSLEQAALADRTPTWMLGVDHLTDPQLRVVRALASGVGVTALQPHGSVGAGWAAEIAGSVTDLKDEPKPSPHVEIHDSHGESRQVEVLRDELSRAFADDPLLEPRDVLIVTPDRERFGPLLAAAFNPIGEEGHPGRTLRVQATGGDVTNPVLDIALDLLRLPDQRATASGLLEFLLRAPIAHRWRLDDRRGLTELIAGAGVRWGLDAGHRSAFGLGDLAQNTWLRGIDRLLVALASAPGDDPGLGLSGAEAISSSDLLVVGSLAELLSRLRHFVGQITTSATVAEWVARVRAALDNLVGLPREDEWQAWQSASILARLETAHPGRTVTRQEFALLLGESAEPWRSRVAAGNGGLHVVPLGELPHVEHKVVAFLGVTDATVPGRARLPADCIDLEGALGDAPARRLDQLLAHARAAERLLIVRQTRSQRTNHPTAEPVAVEWLLDQLGARPAPVQHPPTATSSENFGQIPSFDKAAHRGALARTRLAGATRLATFSEQRRSAARERAVGAHPEAITLAQLSQFLADPAKAFLRGAGGIATYADPSVSNEMTLIADGLSHWSVVDALVESLKTGATLESVATEVSRREKLPPGALGQAAFNLAKGEAASLWRKAAADWAAPVADHEVDLSLTHPMISSPVRLTGIVRTRGGAVVEITASKGEEKIIDPWVRGLALTAAGIPTPVHLHQLEKEFSGASGVTRTVAPLEPDAALAHLSALVAAHCLGHHLLVPAPAQPALRYARERQDGTFRPEQWRGLVGEWRTKKWSRAGESWLMFYDGDVADLFTDQFVATDPHGPSPFEAWATMLYGPLARSLA